MTDWDIQWNSSFNHTAAAMADVAMATITMTTATKVNGGHNVDNAMVTVSTGGYLTGHNVAKVTVTRSTASKVTRSCFHAKVE